MKNQSQSQAANSNNSTLPESDVIMFKRSQLYAALLPLAFVTGIAVGFLFWGNQPLKEARTTEVQSPSPQPESATAKPQARLDIDVDDDPAIGPEDAPITIVEFSDFACGYCRRFHEQTFQELLEKYPDQIRFVYRDLPVVGGYEAAQAAECADEQGAFWEFHDLLFSGGLGLDEHAYREYAETVGIDADSLMECVSEERYAEEVEADAQYAFNLGANGTPTFFINGIPLIGARPISDFEAIIDDELSN
jgi:protein-disulfide isomerase